MTDELLKFARILQRIDDLAAPESAYTSGDMLRWKDMREKFRQERKRQKGLTQAQVAKRAGVDQSAISKIESDPDYTPYVDTFVNAIHGLNRSAAEFFAELEGLQVVRQGDTSVGLVVHAPSRAPISAASEDEFRTFVLDVIVSLQRLVAAHDARRQRRAPDAVDRPTPKPPFQTDARKHSRSRS